MSPPPIDPVGPVGPSDNYIGPDHLDRRENDRRRGDRRNAFRKGREVVATGEGDDPASSVAPAKPAAPPVPPPAAFAAQILGQPGKKRGLKGGPPVLDTARSTYLSREYSGRNDRRPEPGIRKKTEI